MCVKFLFLFLLLDADEGAAQGKKKKKKKQKDPRKPVDIRRGDNNWYFMTLMRGKSNIYYFVKFL